MENPEEAELMILQTDEDEIEKLHLWIEDLCDPDLDQVIGAEESKQTFQEICDYWRNNNNIEKEKCDEVKRNVRFVKNLIYSFLVNTYS